MFCFNLFHQDSVVIREDHKPKSECDLLLASTQRFVCALFLLSRALFRRTSPVCSCITPQGVLKQGVPKSLVAKIYGTGISMVRLLNTCYNVASQL